MSLRRKFIILTTLLGLAVAVNLGTVLWSILFLEREIAAPLGSFQGVMTGLTEVKRRVGDIHNALAAPPGGGGSSGPMVISEPGPQPPRDPDAVGVFESRAAAVIRALDRLDDNESYPMRAGLSTTRNLRTRVNEAISEARAWYASGDLGADPLQARRRLLGLLFAIHELVELIEQRNIDELASAVAYSASLRWGILLILGASALTVVLAVWDAGLFLRRWAINPVARLRIAAERLAAGDFAHRIAITGKDEIAQLSGEVNHMAATIARMQSERIERERLAAVGEVVRRIVHNLRNPMAGIRGLAEYTRGELDSASPLREAQDRIVQSVDRFEGWLAGMLSATRPLEVSPARHEVAPWLTGVVEVHRASAEARGVRLSLDLAHCPESAHFDARHLEQALVAILTNAIDASPRGGMVGVRAAASGAEWAVRVTDDGPGVPAEIRDRVFRPYFTTKPQGSGIGLAVAYQVVAQHGGRITVEDRDGNAESAIWKGQRQIGSSDMGPGAAFVVVLPLNGLAEPGHRGPKGDESGENPGH